MPIAPEEFDYERSRAAVAVACLQWLRCTGPAIEPEPSRVTRLPGEESSIESQIPTSDPADLPHPLWDRWLDG
jgi:hypothetical protein